MESIFLVVLCLEEWKVDQATLYLDGPAMVWWQDNCEKIREYYKEMEFEHVPWEGWLYELKEKFVPPHV